MKKRLFSIMDTALKKTGTISLCVVVVFVTLSGLLVACNMNTNREQPIDPISQNETQPPDTNPTPGIVEQTPENTPDANLETDAKYKTEADFLNHPDGVKFQAAAYKAAKAYLNGDTEELTGYLTESCLIDDVKLDIFKDVEYIILKWSLPDMKSEDNIHASYQFLLKGEDSVSYVSMELLKVDDEWKVDTIGLEK